MVKTFRLQLSIGILHEHAPGRPLVFTFTKMQYQLLYKGFCQIISELFHKYYSRVPISMSYQLQFFEAVENNSQVSLQQRNKNKPINVVFVSHLYTLWGCFASLVTEMQKRSSFQVTVLPVRFVFDDPSICLDHIEHPVTEMLQQGIPVVDPKSYNFNIEKPDIVFFSTPYSFTREFKYNPSLLAMNGIRSALIPYCTELIGGDGFQSFYLGHCNHLWRIFAASEHSSELYKLSLNTPDHFTPVLGNPEYDLVINTPVEQLAKYQHIKT